MARIIRAPAAKADAVEIWAYIAADNPSAADRLLNRFDRVLQKLPTQPLPGKAVEEIAPHLRFIPIGSYLVFYRGMEDGVESPESFTERATSPRSFSATGFSQPRFASGEKRFAGHNCLSIPRPQSSSSSTSRLARGHYPHLR